MDEFHPIVQLPGRPSKRAFGERVSHKLRSQMGKRKLSKSTSSAFTPDVSQRRHVTPGPYAQGPHGPNHVRTHRITSQPTTRVLLKARPKTPQSDHVQPRPGFSILSLAFPEPHIDYPTTTRASPHDPGLEEQQQKDVPRLHRKEPPQLTVRDAFAERFVKLRLPATTHAPLAPVGVPASRITTNFSFPLQHLNSAKTAKSAWNTIAISNPLLPSSRGQPNLGANQMDAKHRREGESSMYPLVIDDSDDSLNFDPIRDGRKFEKGCFFQPTGLSRQLVNRRRTRPDGLDRSPSESHTSYGSIITPDSSVNSESELLDLVPDYMGAALHKPNVKLDHDAQEEEDYQLAQLLHLEMNPTTPSQLAKTSRSSASHAASPENGRLNSLREAITNIGTRDGTINLHSDAHEGTHMRHCDCVICGNSIVISDLPSLANCEHRPEACADCYSRWITAQLQGSTWREAKCPADGCSVVLTYHDIQLYANSETFQQYDRYIARDTISGDSDFRWCQASGCNSGQIHASGVAGNIFTCCECGNKACIVHENTWHEGETCAEYDYRSSGRKKRDQKAQEAASLKAIKKRTKKCPGPGCNWNIEKNEGCNHMKCIQCGYDFCWICMCDFKKVLQISNEIHAKTCPYHPSNLR